jgi:hypothetical protein
LTNSASDNLTDRIHYRSSRRPRISSRRHSTLLCKRSTRPRGISSQRQFSLSRRHRLSHHRLSHHRLSHHRPSHHRPSHRRPSDRHHADIADGRGAQHSPHAGGKATRRVVRLVQRRGSVDGLTISLGDEIGGGGEGDDQFPGGFKRSFPGRVRHREHSGDPPVN